MDVLLYTLVLDIFLRTNMLIIRYPYMQDTIPIRINEYTRMLIGSGR